MKKIQMRIIVYWRFPENCVEFNYSTGAQIKTTQDAYYSTGALIHFIRMLIRNYSTGALIQTTQYANTLASVKTTEFANYS